MGSAASVVLIIDDDDDTLASVGELLEANGFETRRASSGAAALALLDSLAPSERSPSLVLLDWLLPGGPSGGALVEALRRRLGERLPIVIVSGDPQALAEARAAKVSDYLPKPFAAADLVDVVHLHCP